MSSPSASVAVTVPIAVWFSSTLNDEDEFIIGLLSLRLLMDTIIFCEVELPPSEAVTEVE